jgi:hypothetical protein
MRKSQEAEKSRIIQKMLGLKKAGEPTQKPEKHENHLWHCEDVMFANELDNH